MRRAVTRMRGTARVGRLLEARRETMAMARDWFDGTMKDGYLEEEQNTEAERTGPALID